MNSIHSIVIDLHTGNEDFPRSLYSRWEQFYEKNILQITDRLLMKHDDPSIVLEIDELEVDLGTITEKDFDDQFPLLLEAKLEEVLLRSIVQAQGTVVRKVSGKAHLFDVLRHFLLHGSLPWHLAPNYKDINFLFREVTRESGADLKRFLQTYGHQTSLQERLVYQLSDETLEQGMQLLSPGESTFIRGYVRFLRVKYRQVARPEIRESRHRDAVWKVVYAYLLNNRSSHFNKKSFLEQTITGLASHYNLSYERLLFLFTTELETVEFAVSAPPELFLLLEELKNELSEGKFREFLSETLNRQKRISASGQTMKTLTARDLRELYAILSKETTAREFLERMQESEIVSLVNMIIPAESDFIVSYAKVLDRQQEQGLLQGKAGGEFRIVKWQIIFPLMIASSTVSFSRKQFVWSVIKRVSARYNLTIIELLDYLCSTEELGKLRPDLSEVLQNLYAESLGAGSAEKSAVLQEIDIIFEKIREEKQLAPEERSALLARFSDVVLREKVLNILRETARFSLVRMLFPVESPFISAYAKGLDSQRKNGSLEGKAGGSFTRMKWTFVYAVLFESNNLSFNKKYFVGKVIEKMAAHYNVAFVDLLTFFHEEISLAGIAFPFDLVSTVAELYTETTRDRVATARTSVRQDAVISENREQAIKLLQSYFGRTGETDTLITQLSEQYAFVFYLRTVLENVQVLHLFLVSELKLFFDHKEIMQLLIRLAPKYRELSRKEVMRQIVQLFYSKLSGQQQTVFQREINRLTSSSPLLAAVKAPLPEAHELPAPVREKIPEEEAVPELRQGKPVYIANAGMVLLSPFFPVLFSKLSVTEAGKLPDKEAQIRAIFLLQYAVFGSQEFPEHELELNKLLTDFKTGVPIPRSFELSDEDKATVDSMLEGTLKHWGRLANTSIAGLREGFLQRDGRLEEQDDLILLTVEEKAYDMLLDNVPWNFRNVRYSWMKKGIQVKWR